MTLRPTSGLWRHDDFLWSGQTISRLGSQVSQLGASTPIRRLGTMPTKPEPDAEAMSVGVAAPAGAHLDA